MPSESPHFHPSANEEVAELAKFFNETLGFLSK